MISILGIVVSLGGLIVNLVFAIACYKDYANFHSDDDLVRALFYFILSLIMITCIVLCIQTLDNRKDALPAQSSENFQIENCI